MSHKTEIKIMKGKLLCSFCATDENVEWTIDPFLLEIYGDSIEIVLCDKCYKRRLEEI